MPAFLRQVLQWQTSDGGAWIYSTQWHNQIHFAGGQALFNGEQQFNDIISNDVISGVARNWAGGIISTFLSSVFFRQN